MTIWFDFTTTARSTGRNGIAGVEWNAGIALIAAHRDARACRLDGRHGLIEIDPARDLAAATYASDHVSAVPTTATWRDATRTVLRDRLGPTSVPVIQLASRLYAAILGARRTVRQALAWVTGLGRRPEPRVRLADQVGSRDVVISLGADWEGDVVRALSQLKRRSACTVVTMVYDLIPITHTHVAFSKDTGIFERYYRDLIDCSDLILCISESSRRDLMAFAAERGLTVRASDVIALGDGQVPPAATVGDRDDFFLWVGTIERRKNLELLYDAMRLLDGDGHDLPTIVVAGAVGWGVGDLLAEIELQSTPASRRFVLLGPVDETTLASLYDRARALVFPSHYEGWGLPVREAAIRGCPVIAGDCAALREAGAAADGAVFLPTDDPAPWADHLRRPPTTSRPAPFRPWTDFAGELMTRLARGDAQAARP